MTNRFFETGRRALLMLALMAAVCPASERRATPLVRAIERAKSSVVNIHTVKTDAEGEALFGAAKPRKVNGMGTGIVVDERGYIVTNHHVVAGVDSLRVTLEDGGTFAAEVVASDQKHDLAIIRIHAGRPLQVMPLGTSSDIMLGETVIAVGNAYGYEHTVTSGIVSALSRDVEVNEQQSYRNLIQTDASINPGNSGGPLLNLDGDVVGINVAIRAGAQRIGFAIPIDDARRVIGQLMSAEELSGTYHGLRLRDEKTPAQRQLVVSGADLDSPAVRAGFRAGDVVVKAGDVHVVDRADLERALIGLAPGDTVPIRVRRDGEEVALTLPLAQAPNRAAVVRANNDPQADKTWHLLGVQLAALSAKERQAVLPRYRGGMRVVRVRPGSPAEQNGIRQGDVLVGLHIWETVSYDNVSYVLNHDDLGAFNPLKFYVIRGSETLYGHMRLAMKGDR